MKNLTNKLKFTLVALCICSSLFAQKDSQYVIDSLSAKVEVKTGKPKLIALAEIVKLEIFSDNLLSRLGELETEAKKQENDQYLLYSYNYRMIYYIRNNNRDSISRYIDLSAPLAKKIEPTDDIVMQNVFLKVVDYTGRGLFDLALMSQKRYLEKIENIGSAKLETLLSIYIGMGETYYHQGKYEEALKYYYEAKDKAQAIDPTSISYVSTLCLVALCQSDLKNYTTAIQYCDSASSIINNNPKGITSDSRTYLNYFTNLIAIQSYSKLKDFKKAKILIDQLPQNLEASFYEEQSAYYYRTLYSYYSGIKDYDKALEYNKIGLTYLRKNNNILTLPTLIREKASLLYSMQNYKEAYDQLLTATYFTDSIRNSHTAIQLDELAIMYDVDLKDAEIAKTNSQLKFTQTIVIALIIISFLLFIILLAHRKNSRKQEEKNKILFKQHEELNKSISYYRKMIIHERDTNATNINPLFQELEEYMLKEEVYKKVDISREDIASTLKTNRQYLSSAVKEATGLTFTGYINKYRLENARKQLLEKDDIMIDDIIIESGFSSRSTFHRLFKDQYGMAPHELKRAAIALQSEIKEEDNI